MCVRECDDFKRMKRAKNLHAIPISGCHIYKSRVCEFLFLLHVLSLGLFWPTFKLFLSINTHTHIGANTYIMAFIWPHSMAYYYGLHHHHRHHQWADWRYSVAIGIFTPFFSSHLLQTYTNELKHFRFYIVWMQWGVRRRPGEKERTCFSVGLLIKDTKQLVWFMSPWIPANAQWIGSIHCDLKKTTKTTTTMKKKHITKPSNPFDAHTHAYTHTCICTIDWTLPKMIHLWIVNGVCVCVCTRAIS